MTAVGTTMTTPDLTVLLNHGLTARKLTAGGYAIHHAGLDDIPMGVAIGRFDTIEAAVACYGQIGWPTVGMPDEPKPAKRKQETSRLPRGQGTATVLAALRTAGGSAKTTELLQRLPGWNRSQVASALRNLKMAGQVVAVARGTYSIDTDKGTVLLSDLTAKVGTTASGEDVWRDKQGNLWAVTVKARRL